MADTPDYVVDGPRTTTLEITSPTQVQTKTALITATGSIAVAGTQGITSDFRANWADVTVHGSVAATVGVSIILYRGKLTVGAGGSVSGQRAFVCVNDSEIVNVGTISATDVAVETGTTLKLTNTGTIQSTGSAGVLGTSRFFSNFGYQITNSGTIKGHDYAILVRNFQGQWVNDAIIVNNGALQSDGPTAVKTDDGNDIYDARGGGTATGIVDLGNGNNVIHGGSSDEKFQIGLGNSFVDGGAGFDTVTLMGGAGLTVDLNIADAQSTGAGDMTIRGVEGLAGGLQNDVFIGTDAANGLIGNGGSDKLEGGLGNDTLDGGLDGDTLDGGAGFDVARYSGSAGAVVNLSVQGPQNTVNYGMDVLIAIEALEGGPDSDSFTGDDNANRLSGNGGNDTLIGGKGNDTLIGGKGNDTLIGGAGVNVAEFSGSFSDYVVTANQNGTILVHDSIAGRDGDDTLLGIVWAKFNGETHRMKNTGPTDLALSTSVFDESSAVGSVLATVAAQDAESDPLTYSLASDAGGMFRLEGRTLVLAKPLDYETQARHSIAIKVSDNYGGEATQTFTVDVRNAVETDPKTLVGTPGMDRLVGEAGKDTIYGSAGNDQLLGWLGDDRIHGGLGRDELTGHGGRDVFVFDTNPKAKGNADRILDFNVWYDSIYLENRYFKVGSKGSLTKPAPLSSKMFHLGAKAHDADDRIVYDKKKGVLYYDQDGTGAAKAVVIATLSKNLKMTYKDFFVI